MAVPQERPFVTPEEYLRRERAALDKSEYCAGAVFPMPPWSPLASLIGANLIGELGNALKGNQCAPYDSNLRIFTPGTGLYTYPDASVICGPLELFPGHDDMITNPTLIVEVLSDSTEAYDRGKKFAHYRTLPSFAEYVLVSQKEKGRDWKRERVCNFAGGLPHRQSLRQLTDWCARRFGFEHPVTADPAPRRFDLPWVVLDSSLADEIWHWRPRTALADLLEEIAAHAESEPGWLGLSAG